MVEPRDNVRNQLPHRGCIKWTVPQILVAAIKGIEPQRQIRAAPSRSQLRFVTKSALCTGLRWQLRFLRDSGQERATTLLLLLHLLGVGLFNPTAGTAKVGFEIVALHKTMLSARNPCPWHALPNGEGG